MNWFDYGINPSRFIGARYTTPCLGLANMKKDYRPMLTLHLLVVTVWLKLPWRHFDKERGRTIGRSWGAVARASIKYRALLTYWGN